MDPKIQMIERMRALLHDPQFQQAHRVGATAFCRERKLPFRMVAMLILQKSLKSMQLVLNEVCQKLARWRTNALETVSASAFTRARGKLSAAAFVELNRQAVVQTYYASGQVQRWGRHRLLSIDSSRVEVPDTPAIREAFGTIAFCNEDQTHRGEHPYALASVCYDVLNEIALDAIVTRGTAYEVDVAVQHLPYLQAGDLVITDRGYPSYRFLAEIVHRQQTQGVHFVCRCSRSSFAEARALFERPEVESILATLTPHHTKHHDIRRLGLPSSLRVRFVRVVLDSGEVEVLVTSLLDAQRYPTAEFSWVYNCRWGGETYYDRLKNRLNLENFTGKTVMAVQQDFHAAVLLTGLESVLTRDANTQLHARPHADNGGQQVNKAVSLNALKNAMLDLLVTNRPATEICHELTQLFLTKPVIVRPNRKVRRKKPKARAFIRYLKCVKKICY